jgi:hypothetical protein
VPFELDGFLGLPWKEKIVCYEIDEIDIAFMTTLGAALLNPMAKH